MNVDDSAVFADSAAPSQRPIFCYTIVKVDDSADSAKLDCVVAADSMALPIRPVLWAQRKPKLQLWLKHKTDSFLFSGAGQLVTPGK